VWVTQDNFEATPLDIALRNGACAEIISLLSLTPEEVFLLGGEGLKLFEFKSIFMNFLFFKN